MSEKKHTSQGAKTQKSVSPEQPPMTWTTRKPESNDAYLFIWSPLPNKISWTPGSAIPTPPRDAAAGLGAGGLAVGEASLTLAGARGSRFFFGILSGQLSLPSSLQGEPLAIVRSRICI